MLDCCRRWHIFLTSGCEICGSVGKIHVSVTAHMLDCNQPSLRLQRAVQDGIFVLQQVPHALGRACFGLCRMTILEFHMHPRAVAAPVGALVCVFA